MSQNPDAITLARTLAAVWATEAPFTGSLPNDFDSDDACSQVAEALDPAFVTEQDALLAELRVVLDPDQYRKLSDFFGRTEAHAQDGGYLLGLAVGQLVRMPALMPKNGGAR